MVSRRVCACGFHTGWRSCVCFKDTLFLDHRSYDEYTHVRTDTDTVTSTHTDTHTHTYISIHSTVTEASS